MKKVSIRKMIAVCLSALIVVALLAGCGGTAAPAATTAAAETKKETEAPAAETEAPAAETEAPTEGKVELAKYKFAGDIVGQGVAALDDLAAEQQYVFEQIGSDFTIYNDNFTADTQTSNVQTIAASGFDGLALFGSHAELYPAISEICEEAKLPFVFYDQIPTTQEQIDELNKNPYYFGSVGVDNYKLGVNIANEMVKNGVKEAIILGGRLGDVVHDARVNGFTDTFEAAGGKVVGVARCSNPSEATTKEDDLISANANAEATYCLTGDYAVSAIAALDNYPDRKMAIYSSDTTMESIPFIKDGTIVMGDGGGKIATILGSTLIYNAVNGNPIMGPDGNVALLNNCVALPITAENADDYAELFLKGHPMDINKLYELVGPDASYDKYQEFIANFSLENLKK